jgi:NAD(P)-dependent dehydrogenase (short-subunit alcohol dehydrogenase family)
MNSAYETRAWFITGASSGLGRALAETALARGDSVVATGRDPGAMRELEERYPGRAVAERLDVTDPGQAREAARSAVEKLGRIDVLVNNAGFGLFGPLEELADEELRREFDTNVFGAVNTIRAVLPQMRAQRAGHIVQISSLEGVAPALAGECAYAASKFAVEGLCEGLAREVAHLGIGITIVEPGPIRTAFADGATAKAPEHPDYEESVGQALAWFADLDGQQPNDPRRVAVAIVTALDDPNPPLRLALGEEAIDAIREKLAGHSAELDTWRKLGLSTAVAP